MTEVQQKTIPVECTGVDVMARAKTGTGKTIAFLVPTIDRLLKSGVVSDGLKPRMVSGIRTLADVRAVIISPTRELAEQISRDAYVLCKGTNLKVATMVGGTGKSGSLRDFHARGCHILIGTPGRLADVISDIRSGVEVDKVEVLVYDEADSLMDMGFEPQIREIVKEIPRERQTLMFSATMPDKVKQLMGSNLREGFNFINTIDPRESDMHTKVPQHMIQCEEFDNVLPTLFELLDRENKRAKAKGEPFKAMVFFNTARSAELAALMFRKVHFPDSPAHPLFPLYLIQIHSRLSQARRTEAARAFRGADNAVLFSSDVTARGMDFPNVTHVIQVGSPSNREQYIHRIGRTARGSNIDSGKSIGYLILSNVDFKPALRELKKINFIVDQDKDLQCPSAKLDDIDSLSETAGKYAKAVAAACGRLDPDLFFSTYMSWIGFYLSIQCDPNEILRGLYRATKNNFGMAEPPAVGRDFIGRLGFNFKVPAEKGWIKLKDRNDSYGRTGSVRYNTTDREVDESEVRDRVFGGGRKDYGYGTGGQKRGGFSPRGGTGGRREVDESEARDKVFDGGRKDYGYGTGSQRRGGFGNSRGGTRERREVDESEVGDKGFGGGRKDYGSGAGGQRRGGFGSPRGGGGFGSRNSDRGGGFERSSGGFGNRNSDRGGGFERSSGGFGGRGARNFDRSAGTRDGDSGQAFQKAPWDVRGKQGRSRREAVE